MKYPITTQAQIRYSFWSNNVQYQKHFRAWKKQNNYNCEIRTAFCDYVDMLRRDEIISEKLANRATL